MAYTIPSGIVTFANQPFCTVTTGGTAALSQGAAEAWTVSSGATFPVAATSTIPATFFMVADTASTSEIICVTVASTASPWVWNVTRGAEGTSPVTHASNFVVQQVVTAGSLTNFKQASNAETIPVTVATTVETLVASYQPVINDIEAGASFEAIAYGTFVSNNTVAVNREMIWTVRWGGTAGTILSILKTNSNAQALTTTSVAGSSFDMNATITLLSATQATCNMNLFYSISSNSLTAAQATATVTNATGGGASSATPVTISGNGPLVLDFNWGGPVTAQTMTAVSPVIYRVA